MSEEVQSSMTWCLCFDLQMFFSIEGLQIGYFLPSIHSSAFAEMLFLLFEEFHHFSCHYFLHCFFFFTSVYPPSDILSNTETHDTAQTQPQGKILPLPSACVLCITHGVTHKLHRHVLYAHASEPERTAC